MGIRLSKGGGLTFSQKKGLDKPKQATLLTKLSSLEINKPILTQAAKDRAEAKERARKRAEVMKARKEPSYEAKAKSKPRTTLSRG